MMIIQTGLGFLILLSLLLSNPHKKEVKMQYVYNVSRLEQSIDIDANWDKPQWQNAESVLIQNYMGNIPAFQPHTEARMLYDNNNIYVIFKVSDRYVLCQNTNTNDPVWEDSCVEFFFAPDVNFPERYFNLEVNCGGTALMNYSIVPREQFIKLEIDDIAKIEIAHSLPKIVFPEITDSVTWTIEYKIPFKVLEKYSKITRPEKGVVWKGNFYKIAANTSNPHYITWSVVENEEPDFHLPAFFGDIRFK